MFRVYKALLLLFVVASSVIVDAASAPRDGPKTVAVNVTRTTNRNGTGSIVQGNQARAMALLGKKGMTAGPPVGVYNTGFDLTVPVYIGCPPVPYTLAVDTGSPLTWARKDGKKEDSCGSKTPFNAELSYGTGRFNGTIWVDSVELGGSRVDQALIGVAGPGTEFPDDIDGIVGLSLYDGNFPTLLAALYAVGAIQNNVFGLFLPPYGMGTGQLTVGGYDLSNLISPLMFLPLSNESSLSSFWAVGTKGITLGSRVIMSVGNCICDTGTTLVLLSPDAYQNYMGATGAEEDQKTGLLIVSKAGYAKMESLVIDFGNNTSMTLTRDAQTLPQSLNDEEPGAIYLAVGALPSNLSLPGTCIFGLPVFERYYTVLNNGDKTIGFGATMYTNSVVNR